jgi:hypothetical protein
MSETCCFYDVPKVIRCEGLVFEAVSRYDVLTNEVPKATANRRYLDAVS